ncbi:MAG: hypothetical protein SF123_02845 [Chloroflexota bacterium]|nr:hypothetical protein [Chloroflexota bacterium]
MKIKFAIFVFVVLFGVSLVQVSAQSENPLCTPELSLTVIAALAADEPTQETLLTIRDTASQMITLCTGLSFADSGDYVSDIVSIPAGVYRAVFVSDSIGSVAVTPITGECGAPRASANMTLLGTVMDTAGGEDSSVFTSEECTVLIEINTRGTWSLEFEFMAAN